MTTETEPLDSPAEPHVSSIKAELPDGRGVLGGITIRNGAKLNIMNSKMLVQLKDALHEMAKEPHLRAVILTSEKVEGKTPAFCGGADIHEMASLNNPQDAEAFIRKIHRVCNEIRAIPAPVVARIHGICLGAGLEIVAACDFRFATTKSVFSMPEVKVGIPSVVEARLLVNLVGWQRTRRLCMLAEELTAAKAQRWGLVDYVLRENNIDGQIEQFVNQISSHGPKAMKAQKELFMKWEEEPQKHGIKAGIDAFASMWEDGGSEPKQYMRKFINRKKTTS